MSELISKVIFKDIRLIVNNAKSKAYTAVNFAMVEAYWNIGRVIVQAQNGDERAEYGKFLLEEISKMLTKEFGKGFNITNLRKMRKFYITFQKRDAVRTELSWTHYRILISVEKEEVRHFYMAECIANGWSTRELERQINSFYYERLLSSKNKKVVEQNMKNQIVGVQAEDIIKDPYVLEFLGLEKYDHLYEQELEQGLINHLQKFLLELGKGFSFVARQKRISFDGKHFYIDLVFYNYILKCFVLIDLKVAELTHQDLGQMQMYVNYYTREQINEGDNPPIGIVLCADKSDSLVRYTLPENNTQIYASKYKLYLPTEEELKRELEKEIEFLEREKTLNDNK